MAFEYLLKLTPLLDKADQRCKYEKIYVVKNCIMIHVDL